MFALQRCLSVLFYLGRDCITFGIFGTKKGVVRRTARLLKKPGADRPAPTLGSGVPRAHLDTHGWWLSLDLSLTRPPPPLGSTPSYRSYRYEQPQRGYGVFAVLVWNGYRLAIWSGIGYGFRGNCGSVRTCLSFQFQMSWITEKDKYANSKWILWNSFCWRSNPSNDNTIP